MLREIEIDSASVISGSLQHRVPCALQAHAPRSSGSLHAALACSHERQRMFVCGHVYPRTSNEPIDAPLRGSFPPCPIHLAPFMSRSLRDCEHRFLSSLGFDFSIVATDVARMELISPELEFDDSRFFEEFLEGGVEESSMSSMRNSS